MLERSMTTHFMKLKQAPFTMIQNDLKTVECRLYDAKRQKIALGDHIIFSLIDDPSRTIEVKVRGLLRYQTFADMFNANEPRRFGGDSSNELTESLLHYYSPQDQLQAGVLGIDFELI